MKVLIIDGAPLDEASLRKLFLRGYQVQTVPTATLALELVGRTSFDCIVVGIRHPSSSDCPGLLEIRQLAKTSAVTLMMAVPAESIIDRALRDGSIELESPSRLIPTFRNLSPPALVVASELHPRWIQAIREQGIVAVSANTLTFVMNLLADGWCELVLLKADVPGLTEGGTVAIFREIKANLVAILASALSERPSSIVYSKRPETIDELIDLFEQTAEHRLSQCGLAEAGGPGGTA